MISSESDVIANLMGSKSPLFVGRLGSVEAEILTVYSRGIDIQYSPKKSRDNLRRRKEAWISAGIWPPFQSELIDFAREYESALSSVNVMCYWNNKEFLPFEERIIASVCPNHEKLSLEVLDIAYLAKYADSPWTMQLHGKNVLVISSFAELIYAQYEKLETLHSVPILPNFNLSTLKPPVSNGLNFSRQTWSANLKNFEAELAKYLKSNSVDVALIAAGSYGLPISKYLFSQSIKTIYVGGVLQLYFGIWGNRWRQSDEVKALATDKWVNPQPAVKTRGSRLIEGGAYW